MQHLLENLNAEQHAAVTLQGHGLILAGAGSGKTRVLTTRIAWLIHTGQVSPAGLLAVTFTNKAAKEMLTRLSTMLPLEFQDRARGMWVGTFHGLCNRFLRAHHKLAGLPATFQILDTQDQLSAVKRLMKANNIDDERFPPKEMSWFISGAKDSGKRAGDLEVFDSTSRQKAELYALYEAQCQREGVVDFGELLLRSFELLRDHPTVREHYQRRFRHVLIDEFQDTNTLQYAWIKLLTGQGNAVFAVGDDDQSIYAFRGAKVGNMSDFVREFGITQPIKLERNYRSFGNILDCANALIAHNQGRLGKNLATTLGAGEPVRIMENASDYAEAAWAVDEIKQLHASGTARHEMAMLYRSNAQSRVLESALFNAGLPYRVYGGLRFFERAEIKHALAYLRLIENPSDDTSFLRVVNFPPRGIGARSVEQLQDLANGAGTSLHDAVSALDGRAGVNISGFVAKLDALREQSTGQSLRQTVQLVLDHSGLLEHYRLEKDGGDRVENLEELLNAAESFVSIEGFGKNAPALTTRAENRAQLSAAGLSQSPASQGVNAALPATDEFIETGEVLSPLAAFLSHASLEAGDNQAQAGQDAVQLMTIHSAKGLEFDAVFITGLEEGLFPHENSIADPSGLEEERRLMYVAITRARKRLYLSHAQTRMLHGSTRYHAKTRFYDELPEDAVKWLSPKFSGFATGLGGGYGFGGSPKGTRSGFGAGQGYNADYSQRSGQDTWGDVPTRQSSEANRGTGFATPVSSAVQASAGFKPGNNVFHNKFGEGVVLALEGSGADARAQVNFTRHGTKWLALAVAKLTKI